MQKNIIKMHMVAVEHCFMDKESDNELSCHSLDRRANFPIYNTKFIPAIKIATEIKSEKYVFLILAQNYREKIMVYLPVMAMV
jgi:hypothetical protein